MKWWYSYAQLSMMQNIYKQVKIQNHWKFCSKYYVCLLKNYNKPCTIDHKKKNYTKWTQKLKEKKYGKKTKKSRENIFKREKCLFEKKVI
jgi:hypothetical protein